MPRAYHSPSSIELADKCRKAWGLRYITGLRYNDAPWQPLPAYTESFVWPDWIDLKVIRADTSKDRSGRTLEQRLIGRQHSSAFGTAMHSIGEGWFRGEAVDWQSDPGRVFLSGAHLLPHPSRCHEVRIEEPIGTVPYTSKHLGETRLLEVEGIHLMGYIDLEVLPFEEESRRLGIPPGWAVIDYKSTKDLKYPVYDFKGPDAQRWAQKAEALKHDAQAALYAYAHAHSDRSIWHGLERTPAQIAFGSPEPCPPQRWVYFQTQGRPAARAVDVHTTYRDALARVHLMVEQAKVLDTLESIDQCMPNPSACPEYGGCEFHVSKGGPCTAERRLGAAVNQVVKLQQKKETPPMTVQGTPAQTRFQQLAQQRRANLGQAAAPAPAVAPEPTPTPVNAPVAPTNSFGAPVAPAVAGAPRRGRPAAARPPVAAPPPPPPPPPAPVEEEHTAGAAPVYRFTIECSDPAELAAIVEIVNQALAQ